MSERRTKDLLNTVNSRPFNECTVILTYKIADEATKSAFRFAISLLLVNPDSYELCERPKYEPSLVNSDGTPR